MKRGPKASKNGKITQYGQRQPDLKVKKRTKNNDERPTKRRKINGDTGDKVGNLNNMMEKKNAEVTFVEYDYETVKQANMYNVDTAHPLVTFGTIEMTDIVNNHGNFFLFIIVFLHH